MCTFILEKKSGYMKDNEYYMKLALKEARKAYKHNEVPVGAIIVSNDKIIAKGNNQRENSGDVTKHAELIAIRKASKKKKDWRLNDCTMYVTLFPCPMCASAIVQSRISKLVIGTSTMDLKNKEIVNLIFLDSIKNKKIILEENVLENECSNILKSFFQMQRQK